MRLQEAIRRQLVLATTATYAIAGTRVYWNANAKDPSARNWVELRKAGHRSLTAGAMQPVRLPGEMAVEVFTVAKSQELAADLADAVCSDLIGFHGIMPSTSPPTADAVHCNGIFPADEEDVRDEELFELNLFAERRTYLVRYR